MGHAKASVGFVNGADGQAGRGEKSTSSGSNLQLLGDLLGAVPPALDCCINFSTEVTEDLHPDSMQLIPPSRLPAQLVVLQVAKRDDE